MALVSPLFSICHPKSTLKVLKCFPVYSKGLDAHKYKNTLDCVMRIIKYEGIKA